MYFTAQTAASNTNLSPQYIHIFMNILTAPNVVPNKFSFTYNVEVYQGTLFIKL